MRFKTFEEFVNEYNKFTGDEVAQHIEDITPDESDIPDYFIDKFIKPNDGWELKEIKLKDLLKDRDFKDYYNSGEERYDEYEVDPGDLYNDLVVYKGKLLDGYSRATKMLRDGEKTAGAYVLEQFIGEGAITSVIDRIGEEDDYECKDMSDYVNHFLSRGAKRLSGGASAEILTFRSGIIKIFSPINDPGMTRFLSFCLSNKNNPFVPKISKILKSWASEEDRWIFSVFMENLIPSRSDFERDLNDLFLNDTFSIGFKFGESKSEDNRFFVMLKEIIMRYSKYSNEKDIDSILNFLQGSIRKYKYSVDFGPQNWMMRGNQLVLIDPFWPDME